MNNKEFEIETTCDDCGKSINLDMGEEFIFEVPPEHAEGKRPFVCVCRKCWNKKGYRQIQERYERNAPPRP